MQYHIRKPWQLAQKLHTPEDVYVNRRWHRREFLRTLGLSAAGIGMGAHLIGCDTASDEEVLKSGKVLFLKKFLKNA